MRRNGKIFMGGMSIVLAVLALQGAAWAGNGELTVMTRNLYLGADLRPALTALLEADGEQFLGAVYGILGMIEYNNFPERAEALAAEIAEKKPHLVGLQEVYNFTVDGANAEPPFTDYLQELQSALEAQGADYTVAAVVRHLDLALPFGPNMVGIVDRDVILARSDVDTEVIDLSGLCRASVDGCNYQAVAALPNPLGTADEPLPPIAIERGFVAVEAEWAPGSRITFVNTHLEVREVGPFGLFQALQASELIGILGALNSETPIVLVGDFNSDPGHPVLESPFGPIVPPYLQLTAAGFVDHWTLRPGKTEGLSCCQDGDLLNRESVLYERVDLIFTSEKPESVKTNLVGTEPEDKTPSGLWPSDHAGVVSRFEPAP